MGPLDYENTWINLVDRSQERPENNPGAVAINSSLRILFVHVSTITQQLLQNPLKGQDCATAAAFWGFPWNDKLKFTSLDLTCHAWKASISSCSPLFLYFIIAYSCCANFTITSSCQSFGCYGQFMRPSLERGYIMKNLEFILALQYMFLYY